MKEQKTLYFQYCDVDLAAAKQRDRRGQCFNSARGCTLSGGKQMAAKANLKALAKGSGA